MVDEYAVYIIIENLIEQIDEQGWFTGILEEMVSFCCDADVYIPILEKAYTNLNGIQRPLITTRGLDVQVKWRGQSTDWFSVHMIKE